MFLNNAHILYIKQSLRNYVLLRGGGFGGKLNDHELFIDFRSIFNDFSSHYYQMTNLCIIRVMKLST